MLMYHKFVLFDVFSHSNGDNVETIGNFVETKFNSYFQYIVLENFSSVTSVLPRMPVSAY